MPGHEATCPRQPRNSLVNRALGRAAISHDLSRLEQCRELGANHGDWRRQYAQIGARDRLPNALAIRAVDLLVGEGSHFGARHGLRQVDADQRDLRRSLAHGRGNRRSDQSEAEDCETFHLRTTAPISRRRSANSTASVQRSVAATRGTSPSRPTQVRKMTPSAPPAIAAQATACEYFARWAILATSTTSGKCVRILARAMAAISNVRAPFGYSPPASKSTTFSEPRSSSRSAAPIHALAPQLGPRSTNRTGKACCRGCGCIDKQTNEPTFSKAKCERVTAASKGRPAATRYGSSADGALSSSPGARLRVPPARPIGSIAIHGRSPPMLPQGPSTTVERCLNRRDANRYGSLTRVTCATASNSLKTETSLALTSPTTPRIVRDCPLDRWTSNPAATRKEITLSIAASDASGSITTIMLDLRAYQRARFLATPASAQ